jgi:hypothetical protein
MKSVSDTTPNTSTTVRCKHCLAVLYFRDSDRQVILDDGKWEQAGKEWVNERGQNSCPQPHPKGGINFRTGQTETYLHHVPNTSDLRKSLDELIRVSSS